MRDQCAEGRKMARERKTKSDTKERSTMQISVIQNPVAEVLDDLAALGQHWARNRERGRMPRGIRTAMIETARDLLAAAQMMERER